VLVTSLPEWLYPGPDGGWTADDLDALPPDAPRRIELIDGALVLLLPHARDRPARVREKYIQPLLVLLPYVPIMSIM
jgi:hypothetical protein